LNSNLNHAVEATDAKPAASKTAIGLQFDFTFTDNLSTDNGMLLKKYPQKIYF
jgi:hypothetical protein